MNHFEEICKYLLEAEGYWVLGDVKVDISKEEKRQLNKPTMPRPEIDIVAYSCTENTLYLIEVKTYLNSRGVVYQNLESQDHKWDKYKILTWKEYQEIVSQNLKLMLVEKGMVDRDVKIRFGLIAARLYQPEKYNFKNLAQQRDWLFWGPDDIRKKIFDLSTIGYEDNPYSIISKILNA